MFKKNLQKVSKTETLDDFLEISGNTPKGDMYAEYKQNQNGQLFIRLYQNMSDVIEAKVVMLHTQWMGVLFTQNLDVCYGQVREFEVNCPDIDTDNKFGKPINSVWFRVAIAIRTAKGIYYSRLVNYDLNTEIEREGNIYDIRKLYRKPIGKRYICGIEMTALPYYAENKCLSMKYVRNDQLFRSQFTNELINVSIKNDKIKVKYEVEGIEKAISIATNVNKGLHISYILTEDGKVYRLEDDLNTLTSDYKGSAVDLGLTNVVKIGIDKNLKFKINSESETVLPCVYVKTDDDRIFTDEVILEGEKVVELIEKKEELVENTSES